MKTISKVLVTGLTALVMMSGHVQAEAISSDSVMQSQYAKYNKSQLIEMVSREDVQNKLVSLGVSGDDAIARINGMTDNEIAQLNNDINEAPAGGIVGTVLTVLAVIAILDLAGVTDVYPFIRPISN
jgi:Mg2+ and Co2+ transporter CorA